MSPVVISIIGIFGFLVLAFLGIPVAFSFLIVGLVGVIFLQGLAPGLTLLGTVTYAWASEWSLVCLPLFILMGQYAFRSGISSDLFNAAYKWVGRLPGGLALTTILACTGFAACTGSAVAASATMATLSFPEMERYNYNRRLSTGCVSAGATLGILIPPSVIFIIYGVITETSIAKLFIGGILPGLLLAALFIVLVLVMCLRDPQYGPAGAGSTWREKFSSLSGTWGMIVLFGLVIGGLYVGIFSPSEAGAIGAFGSFVIVIARRRLTKSVFSECLKETLITSCFTFTVLIGAMIFSTFLMVAGLALALGDWITSLAVPPIGVVIFIIILYIPLGMFMDGLPMILLTMPIFFPIVKGLGFDPVWFGVVATLMVQVANISPPVGISCYVVQGVTKVPLDDIFRGTLPFIVMVLLCVVLLVAFPQIILFLPNKM